MEIKHIQAKVLLGHVKQPDTYFGLRYNMNLYRGCQHGCIYCDSRSLCYQIEDFDGEVLVKINAIELLRKELASKRNKGAIGLGSMNDPYMPIERTYKLTRQALEVIAEFGFQVHIITKSDMVVRDVDLLERIAETYATVSFTLTTTDDALAAKIEPRAPRPSARLKAMHTLADHGIQTGVTMMPVLPFIEDNEENIQAIVEKAADAGATYILPSMGMTLREGSREHYYQKLDQHFPGLRQRYERVFGDRYSCHAPYSKKLYFVFQTTCESYSIVTKLPLYTPQAATQPRLF